MTKMRVCLKFSDGKAIFTNVKEVIASIATCEITANEDEMSIKECRNE